MQEGKLRKGPWLDKEDERLAYVVAILGQRRWDALAKASECSGSNTTSSNSEPKSSYGKYDNCSSADSLDATEVSDNSSNETRLLDWMIPSWSYEQSQMEHHMYFCRLNLCSCNYPHCSSSEDNFNISTWDDTSSSSIWE
ncbi:hypothetical protein RND71_031224 [Anisodus tanguticus]|uniref:Myb-like domain-containing protein n=1 Tax=Anisodus tanguticus TaxID=243964 RepID=A0AAE1RBY9_9SOLA|nr:hypothetical protein RND71_031224 [Anisodus tanguticus]